MLQNHFMKKITLIFLLIAGCFTVSLAQRGPKGGKKQNNQVNQEKRFQEMASKLSLSNEQQEKIKTILADTRKEMKSNRQKYKGNKKCLAQSKYQTKKATDAKIMAVLTPDQQTKFQQEKQLKKEERKKKKEEELSKPIDCSK
jgi:protein CpxP